MFISYKVQLVAVYTFMEHQRVSGLYVQVFHSLFWPLEFTVPGRDNNRCYAKIICNKLDDVRLLTLFYIVVKIETVASNNLKALMCHVNDNVFVL